MTGYYIDTDYFVGNINLPNTDSAETQNEIELYIKKYESIFLTNLLGKTLYDLVVANTTSWAPITVTGVYDDLVNGAAFTDSNGDANYFEGINGGNLFVTGGFKRSPVANYVYWHIMRDRASNTAGIGEMVTSVENGIRISPAYKMAEAWNEMVDLLLVMNDYLIVNEVDFPSYIGFKYPPAYNGRVTSLRSPGLLYEYMKGNQKLFVKQNALGL